MSRNAICCSRCRETDAKRSAHTQRNALLVHYNKTYYPSYLIAEWEHARNLAQLLTVLRKIMTVSAN